MKNRVIAGTVPKAVKWAAVSISILALACLVGTATAGSKTSNDKKADAEKSYKKVMVIPKDGDRPFLGVSMQALDDEVRKGLDLKVKNGVLVTDVIEDSPAQKAGIEKGDVIVEFDRRDVNSPDGLRELVASAGVGNAVKIKVVRDGEPKTIAVTIGTYPEEESWSFEFPEYMQWFDDRGHAVGGLLGRARLGVRVSDVNEDLGGYFGVKGGGGVLVLDVTKDSVGDKLGLKAGDVIVKVDDEKVGSAEDLREAVGELEAGEEFTLALVRGKKSLELSGEMDEEKVMSYSQFMPRKFDVRVPKIEMRGVPEAEMESLKQEMKALKKELQNLKEELEKVKEST